MDPLLLESGTSIAARIRSGALTSEEAVERHIAHALEVNPTINAIVADRFDAARREAREADRRRGSKKAGPFLGVPCTVKECFRFTGMPQTAGVVGRIGTVSDTDASTVARLRGSGAIPLGVTNTSEACMWMESDNRVYGLTRNPYDPSRTVGGSSGGEGAIVGSGASPFGLGSDIGGSIRLPAFFNGVFGHKPSGGLVPGSGQFPPAQNDARRMLATGPITRRAEDLFPLLRILAGPDGLDPVVQPMLLRDPAKVKLSTLRVLDVAGDGRMPVVPELRDAQRRAADHLRSLGAAVRPEHLDSFRHAFELWSALMDEASETTFAEIVANGRPMQPVRDLIRWATRPSTYTLPALLLGFLEKLPGLLRSRSKKMVGIAEALKAEMSSKMDERTILLYPPFPRLAPRHGEPVRRFWEFSYTAIFNVLELPVTQVPMGLAAGDRGSEPHPEGRGERTMLPTGVQVVAGHGLDHVTIAVASELERAFGGWVPPPAFFAEKRRPKKTKRRRADSPRHDTQHESQP